MLRRAVNWLASRDGASTKDAGARRAPSVEGPEPAAGAAEPPSAAPEGAPAPDSGSAATGQSPRGVMMALPNLPLPHKGPVFASRAVRDAKIVGGVLVSLRAYVDGQEPADQLVQRLEALTPEQTDFLRLSLDLDLADRAGALADATPGWHSADLRRLLGDLAARPLPAEPPPAVPVAEPAPAEPPPAEPPPAEPAVTEPPADPVVETAPLVAEAVPDLAPAVSAPAMPTVESPVAAAIPAVELPVIDIPTVEIPTVEIPAVDIPVLDVPVLDVPVPEIPVLEIPVDAIPAGSFPAAPAVPAAPVVLPEPEPLVVAEQRPAAPVRQPSRLDRDAAAARRAALRDQIAREYL